MVGPRLVAIAHLSSLAAAVVSSNSAAGRGFAPKAPPPSTSPAPEGPKSAAAKRAFLEWADENKIEQLEPLSIDDHFFGGERGVGAKGNIAAGAAVLSVPARLAVQTNTLSRPPRWCGEDAWKAAKWDVRLAMLLLHEKNDRRSNLKPWFDQLPQSLCTPLLNPALLAGLQRLDYPPLPDAVAKQRADWDAALARAPESPSKSEWDWAMSIVRSRAFSGPYTSSTFIGALAQLFLASTACLGYAVVIGGAGASDQAFDALCFAVVFILSNEFVFGPRLTKAKRYVLCPWIDFINHDGNNGGSEVSYEYFRDAFAARLDPNAGPLAAGDQLLISYGARSNDVLLQYYGFVQVRPPTCERSSSAAACVSLTSALRCACTCRSPTIHTKHTRSCRRI